ncbi:MAG: DNA polymerase [Gammaproteobacteria bacterium]|nr:DNA polymerase [Gammaproteobacteria bacterium]
MDDADLSDRVSHLGFNPPSFLMDMMEWNQPRPDLLRTMGQLKHQTKDVLIFDMETDGLLEECTKIHCIAITTPNGDTSLFAQDDVPMALHHLTNAECIIGHNILGFDIPVIKKLYPTWQTQARIRDTLVLSKLGCWNLMVEDAGGHEVPKKLWGSHSLKAWGHRLGVLKGEFNNEETDWSTYTMEMGDYCVQDTVVTLHLAHRLHNLNLPKAAIDLEHDFATELVEMKKNGVGFDVEGAAKLYGELLTEKDAILAEISQVFPPVIETLKQPQYWIQPSTKERYRIKSDAPYSFRQALVKGPMKTKEHPFNPNSRAQIVAAFVEKYGWEPKEYTDHPTAPQAKMDESILEKLDFPEAIHIKRYMMINKRLGQLAEGTQAWLKLEKDGRIYGSVDPMGCVSHRCTHSKPNLSQVPNPRAEYGPECRGLFVPRPGYKIVGADMSGLELRCLAHFMFMWDKGAYVDLILNGDVHSHNQEAMGVSTRDKAKEAMYAFLYGVGNEAMGHIIGTSERAGAQLKRRLLKGLPALNELMKDVKDQSKKHNSLKALDGRIVLSRSDHSALNLLMQSTGAILMKKATVLLMEEIRKRGLDAKLVLHVHDEVQLEVHPDHAELVGMIAVRAMQLAGKHFKLDCPMDGEYNVGNNWAETH